MVHDDILVLSWIGVALKKLNMIYLLFNVLIDIRGSQQNGFQ